MAQATKNGARSSGNARQRKQKPAKPRAKPAAKADTTSAGPAGSDLAALAAKAKVPAIASGAAIAGVAGGLALSARRDGSMKVLGVKLPARSRSQMATKNLAEAASHAASFGDQLGYLATELRRVREGFEARGTRSPIEVVLQGLTRRGAR